MNDGSLKALSEALKAVFTMLKSQNKARALTFALLVGKQHQGKSTLLSQSELQAYPVPGEAFSIYYHEDGVVLELSESWLIRQDVLLSAVLLHLNRVYPSLPVSAVILCVDVQAFINVEPDAARLEAQKQVIWIKRFLEALDHEVGVSVFLTKCDGLAGFAPFFQSDHASEWQRPLGFSIESRLNSQVTLRHYREQFGKLVNSIAQAVLPKLHAVRSSELRTQIREFPLQLASMRPALQALLEGLVKAGIRLQGLYWMSAVSHATPVDRLSQKFEQGFGLRVAPSVTPSRSHPAYFVRGALEQVLAYNKKTAHRMPKHIRLGVGVGLGLFVGAFIALGVQHMKAMGVLDEAKQELSAYQMLVQAGEKSTAATYHLSQALKDLAHMPRATQQLGGVKELKTVLQNQTHRTLAYRFIPELTHRLEDKMRSPRTGPAERYEALKTYLQLTSPEHASPQDVQAWFEAAWAKNPPASPEKAKLLLKEALAQPVVPGTMNEQLVKDMRNHLNALPASYLFYAIAKNKSGTARQPIHAPGLLLPQHELPSDLTKAGFQLQISQLNLAAKQLQDEAWVLEGNTSEKPAKLLKQAYCTEYVNFWKQMMKQTRLKSASDFHQAQQLADMLYKNESVSHLIHLIQVNTAPMDGDEAALFNEQVASQFTPVHFISERALEEMNQSIRELARFLSTLAIVHDQGQTAFAFVKARFQDETFSDALGLLYQRTRALPAPLSEWTKGLADATWSMLIQEARAYLNADWKKTVYTPYAKYIAQHYPFAPPEAKEVSLKQFDRFFSPHGTLAHFVQENIRPFIDTSKAQWEIKTKDGLRMPMTEDMLNELIRANVISNMFFADNQNKSQVQFSIEKMALDPVVSRFSLAIGEVILDDDQDSHEQINFHWPAHTASLKLEAIDGGHFDLSEVGVWGFFKMLQKLNVVTDPEDAATLQILFEINGNAGRYVLRTKNQINPFSPGVLDGFTLAQAIV